MNKVKKNLIMQDLIVHCHLAKRSHNSPIQSKENQMDVDSTPFEELREFHGLRSWKKK